MCDSYKVEWDLKEETDSESENTTGTVGSKRLREATAVTVSTGSKLTPRVQPLTEQERQTLYDNYQEEVHNHLV